MDSGDRSTTLWLYLMPLNYTLKNCYYGTFPVYLTRIKKNRITSVGDNSKKKKKDGLQLGRKAMTNLDSILIKNLIIIVCLLVISLH